jgi:hypothetical protein
MEHGGVPLLTSDNVEQTTPIVVCRVDIGKCPNSILALERERKWSELLRSFL